MKTDDDLKQAGLAAIRNAAERWKSDVIDPPANDHSPRANQSRLAIDDIMRASGWTWQIPYKGDGQVEWCGLFAAACWHTAGIDPKWLATYFASTYRLDIWARYQAFDDKHLNARPLAGPWRMIANLDAISNALPFEPQAGDILTIGDGTPKEGDHICLVESWDESRKVFSTIEGNGVGIGPDGKRRQGIVRGVRHLGGQGYCARRLIRLAPSDLL